MLRQCFECYTSFHVEMLSDPRKFCSAVCEGNSHKTRLLPAETHVWKNVKGQFRILDALYEDKP